MGRIHDPDINEIPRQLRQKWADQGYAPKYELMPI